MRPNEVVDVCSMKQEEVEQIAVGNGTVFIFARTELACHEVRKMAFPSRSKTMTCYYMKPEERAGFSSGWDYWHDLRGSIIYSKCLQLANE